MTAGPNFAHGSNVAGMKLLGYISWAAGSLRHPGDAAGQLCIPEMQRGQIWGPDRILGVWRSVLEGMPLGAFYLVPQGGDAGEQPSVGPGVQAARAMELLDGQQRTRALILGMVPPMRDSNSTGEATAREEHRCLWVALDKDDQVDLFLTTRGQPFGYDRDGRRLGVQERREARKKWDGPNPLPAAAAMPDYELFHADRGPPPPAKADEPGKALPLHRIIAEWQLGTRDPASLAAALGLKTDPPHTLLERLVPALHNLERGDVALIRVASPPEQKDHGEWRLRLFGRIGTAGVPLSQADQRFSIFKHHRPGSRAATDRIARAAGRMMAPPEIMSAALRIARAQGETPSWWPDDAAAFSRAMRSNNPKDQALCACLDELLSCPDVGGGDGSPQARGLFVILRDINAALRDDGKVSGLGLPSTMVLPLQAEAKEILAYWRYLHSAAPLAEMGADMIRFALAWELCVWDHPRAVVEAFKFLRNHRDTPSTSFPLLGLLQSLGVFPPHPGSGLERVVARVLLPPERLEAEFSPDDSPSWIPWDDCARRQQIGEETREQRETREIYEAWRQSRGRLLAWLQRDYLRIELDKLGPDVGHEDDWPLDLDHLQPQSSFSFSWRNQRNVPHKQINKNSNDARYQIGNAVGNYAWLTSADNRSYGNTPVAVKLWRPEDGQRIPAMEGILDTAQEAQWKALSAPPNDPWTLERMKIFQHTVERRTLWLYRQFWKRAGFETLWHDANARAGENPQHNVPPDGPA